MTEAAARSPEVSVVVSTYRRAALLPRLVAALESQSLQADRFEVLVVDNGSDDGTWEELTRLAAGASIDLRPLRIEVNQGPAPARNLGWRSSRAPLVAFTDDDCVPRPDWLTQALASARATPDLGVLQGAILRPVGAYPYGPHTVYRETLRPSPYFEGCNLVFPRAVLERTGGFDESFGFSGEDTAAGWAAIEDGGRWLFDETCAVTHDIVERPLRWHLMMAWREGNLVDVAARHPAMRTQGFWRPWAHRPWNVAVAVGVAGTVVAARWRPALLAWLPWLWLRRPPFRAGPRDGLHDGPVAAQRSGRAGRHDPCVHPQPHARPVTRVLVLGLLYPPHHTGGYEVSCRDVVERLAQRGHELEVLTSDLRRPGVDDPPDERAAEVPVHRGLKAWFRDDELFAPTIRERVRMERASQRALRALLDRFRPDVVSAWQMGALSLGLLTTVAERGIPIVYAVSDDWLSYALELDAWSRMFRRRPPALGRLAQRVLGVPTHVPDLGGTGPFCFISEVTRRRAAEYSPWTMDDTTIVYSGIDGSLFTPSDPSGGDRPWSGRLLYVGRYDPRKGIETAIRAMPHLDVDITLEVQGTGDAAERDRLVKLATDLGVGDRVEFGAVDRVALVERYRAADVVVFPSEWEEPFGLVPLEAMACGTPVAATGVGGSGEFLFDGVNCVRFQPGQPEDLASAVHRLAGDEVLRARLVERGFVTARYFDVDALTDSFEAWHSAAADRFSGGRPPARSFDLGRADDAA